MRTLSNDEEESNRVEVFKFVLSQKPNLVAIAQWEPYGLY